MWKDADDSFCHICGETRESILHALRDCKIAPLVWNKIVPATFKNSFFNASLTLWLENNLQNDSDKTIKGIH